MTNRKQMAKCQKSVLSVIILNVSILKLTLNSEFKIVLNKAEFRRMCDLAMCFL